MQFIMFGGCVVLPPIFGAAIGLSGGYMLPFLAIAHVTAAVCAYLLLPLDGQDREAACYGTRSASAAASLDLVGFDRLSTRRREGDPAPRQAHGGARPQPTLVVTLRPRRDPT